MDIIKKTIHTLAVFLLVGTVLIAQTPDLIATAKEHYSNQEFQKAIEVLDQLLNQDPQNVEAYKIRGNCYFDLDQWDKAKSDYQSALKIDPEFQDAAYNLANVYEYSEQYDSAAHFFRKYIALDSSDPDAYARLAINEQSMGKTDSVMYLLEYAYALDSANFLAHYYLIQNYYYNSQFQKSIEFSNRAKKIDSSEIYFFLMNGLSQFNLGEIDQSLVQFDSALLIDPSDFEARYLQIRSKIVKATDPQEIFQNQEHTVKLTNLTSSNLDQILKQISSDSYGELKTRMISGETLALNEYLLFYVSQKEDSGFSPYGGTANQQFKELFNQENFTELVKIADQAFQQNPIKLDDLYMASIAHYVTEDYDGFDMYYQAYSGIIQAIMASGDGMGFDSAYIVVSTSDEYSLMNHLGLKSQMQSLQSDKGHSFDVLSGKTQGDQDFKIYFNIDIPFSHLSNSMSGDKSKKGKKKKKKKNKN